MGADRRPFLSAQKTCLLGSGLFLLRLFRRRGSLALLALGRLLRRRRFLGRFLLRTIDQLDVRHRRVVAGPEAAAEHAYLAPRAAVVARAELGEELGHDVAIAQPREGDPPVGEAVVLGARDEGL